MKVFISWSGERSKSVARALRDWLKLVIHPVKPWMSEKDIDAGARWPEEPGRELRDTKFAIICLTRDNQTAPWINCEAGAASSGRFAQSRLNTRSGLRTYGKVRDHTGS
jgi:hypothetical protein